MQTDDIPCKSLVQKKKIVEVSNLFNAFPFNFLQFPLLHFSRKWGGKKKKKMKKFEVENWNPTSETWSASNRSCGLPNFPFRYPKYLHACKLRSVDSHTHWRRKTFIFLNIKAVKYIAHCAMSIINGCFASQLFTPTSAQSRVAFRPIATARLNSSAAAPPTLIRNEPVFAAPAPIIHPLLVLLNLSMLLLSHTYSHLSEYLGFNLNLIIRLRSTN